MLALELRPEQILPPTHQGGRVGGVAPGSPAARAGVRAGDLVQALDGIALIDEIDLKFRQDRSRLTLTIDRDGVSQTLRVRKYAEEDLGVSFEDGLFDGIRECNNRCTFCFLKGLPSGLRRSLYFKDDDYRLSFLYGNFVTLTNLADRDWQRIVEQRLSPLYVSVHATDLAVRRRLLGNSSAPDVREQLQFLAKHGNRAHTQLVITPGVNDGDILDRSIGDLADLYPAVQSIGVVPVGLTERGAFRTGLNHELITRLERRGVRPRLVDEAGALAVVRQVSRYQKQFRRMYGVDLVYLADEYYLRAGRPVPAGRRYDGYPQFQNGIGMVRDLLEQLRSIRRHPPSLDRPVRLTAVAGLLAASILGSSLGNLMNVMPRLEIGLVPVENTFFGSTVTASGLLTTEDVIRSLEGRDLGAGLAIPRSMLDSTGTRFLDGGTPGALSSRLGVPVRPAGRLRDLIRFAQEVG